MLIRFDVAHVIKLSFWMQGEAQCCVTGAAFEHMLQLGDLALLETVMRNAVVFSRMKPHQKGQVMDLLGTRGLHQVIDGQRAHLPVSHLLGLPKAVIIDASPLSPASFPSTAISVLQAGSVTASCVFQPLRPIVTQHKLVQIGH